jgi:isopentenyl diphosphate isomerase/L-lactate dehydrogenase-like FMN-dependent dehydrogenase
MNHDDELRERFASLRREDALKAPSFTRLSVTAARPVARSRLRLAAAAGIVLAVAAAFVGRIEWHERAVRQSLTAMPLAEWRSPTDFLLDTSGTALLRDVPRIGAPALNEPAPTHRRGQERAT